MSLLHAYLKIQFWYFFQKIFNFFSTLLRIYGRFRPCSIICMKCFTMYILALILTNICKYEITKMRKEKLDFFGRYLISNWHFLRSPYQIYQRNLFYLLLIVKNNCVQFSYRTLSLALQLRDWMNRCVGGRFIQSWNSKVKEIKQ
jgi:hypothetical protein